MRTNFDWSCTKLNLCNKEKILTSREKEGLEVILINHFGPLFKPYYLLISKYMGEPKAGIASNFFIILPLVVL